MADRTVQQFVGIVKREPYSQRVEKSFKAVCLFLRLTAIEKLFDVRWQSASQNIDTEKLSQDTEYVVTCEVFVAIAGVNMIIDFLDCLIAVQPADEFVGSIVKAQMSTFG